ncbi:glycoside hydrolase family 15 protein [Phreatobacter aquaticus]|uniref:Glycoside hydrolase family 15 protein n=2 Tax=Phreatobacter aquaticus TaxID=2570229 RepID=A0A4D7QTP6_9HYPH|nr:glycoside hydrolase family 15 protein [Phreatobacter aquaticus]
MAVIGNCTLAALIDQRASILWACWPRIDGDPLFSALVGGKDPQRGVLRVDMDGVVSTSQSYERNTAILRTVMTAENGSAVRITDFAPRFKQYDRVFRPPMLIRRIEPIAGSPHIRVIIRPTMDYGRFDGQAIPGSNHIRYVSEAGAVRVTSDIPVAYLSSEAKFPLTRPVTLIIHADETFPNSIDDTSAIFLKSTRQYWLDWVRYLSVPFEWQEAVIRAAITLKLCSSEETGAIVAALTTSIPEAAGSGRNWDYRFCWLRDAYFTVHALNKLGATLTMERFLDYTRAVIANEMGGRLKPVYGIVPEQDLREWIADALPGFNGDGPVRIGNEAAQQIQHDVFGSVILAASQMFYDSRLPKMGDVALFQELETLGEAAVASAFQPDAGVWEYRGRQSIHTHSAAMCFAACDKLAQIAAKLDLRAREGYWRNHAETIRSAILERTWNEKEGLFGSSFDGAGADASTLLLHELGVVAADDPRFIRTVETLQKRLTRSGFLLRYDEKDDFGLPSTSFNICTFWLAEALHAIGRVDEAREIFEGLLARRNHVGLLSEDMDPITGDLWGNFPQTYSMVGIIVTAMRLSKPWVH